MELRDYQKKSVSDCLAALAAGKNPVIQLPTGAGKSLVGAAILLDTAENNPCAAMAGLSVTHTRELIRQNASCFARYAPHIEHGIYSAGLGEKRLDAPIIFAGVQSLVNADFAPPEIVMIDEAHRTPPDADTQYGQILTRACDARRIGLTATPYRMDGGRLHDGAAAWFDTLITPVTTAELQQRGYLSALTGVASRDAMDVSGVRTRGGDFVSSDLAQVACEPECVERVCRAIMRHAADRRAVLIYSVTVAHAHALADRLNALGWPTGVVDGGMSTDRRDAELSAFSSGRDRALVNCSVLTTGYDYPGIDCIACVRPTQSMSLWVQMVGRGLRTAEGKTDCRILDFGGNWARHGRDLDGLPGESVVDEVQQDAEKNQDSSKREESKYNFRLSDASDGDTITARVRGIAYKVQNNKKNPAIKQVMAVYKTDAGNATIWLLPEHRGYARTNTESWFHRRASIAPSTAETTAILARSLPIPESVALAKDGSFWRIKIEHF